MKAFNASLLLALAALSSSSIYFWSELKNARERAAELESQRADLDARLAQLERLRGVVDQRRAARADLAGARAMGAGGAPPVAADGSGDAAMTGPRMSAWSIQPPQRSEAMQKMMRVQARAHTKRLYADVGSTLGLSKDQTNKLIDLITDQQAGGFEPLLDGQSPEDLASAWAEKQRRLQSEIADLLGPGKVAALEDYQKSLPARSELEMLARQLDGYEAPLNEDQRKRLLAVMAEERERIPMPDYVDGADPAEFQKSRLAWEDDYNERVMAQSRNILSSAQMNAYTEYQQAQKDMRAQFSAAMPMMPGAPARMIRGLPGGGVAFATTTPAAGPAMAVDAVIVNAPPAVEKRK